MINVSNAFKEAMKKPMKELDGYINVPNEEAINGSNNLISIKISCDSGMCKTAMRKLEAKYLGDRNIIGKWVNVGFGVKLADNSFEYLDFGSFQITEITFTKDTGVTQIVGYDKMINAMKPYSKMSIEYPMGLYDYTKLLCSICGLELKNQSFQVHNDWQITQDLWENIDGITYRDILVQIAQVTCTTCIITNDDKIYFKPLTETNEELTYDNMKKFKLEPKYGEINSVSLTRTPVNGEVVSQSDPISIENNGLTEFIIDNNEIIDKNRENAIAPIYNALHGISYYPFEVATEGLGWYEIADSFEIVNDLGDVFETSLFCFSITIDGGIKETLKTIAETKAQAQYQFATTIDKRIKNTEITVNKQEQEITSLVKDVRSEDGIVQTNFTQIYQNINNIVNNVQTSGGDNLIKNSVMFAYESNGQTSSYEFNPVGSGYTFALNENGYYESNNKNVQSTTAVATLNFSVPNDNSVLRLECINYALAPNQDYGTISNIDTATIYRTFRNESSHDIKTVEFTNIEKGEHTINLRFRHASSSTGSLQVRVAFLSDYDSILANDWKIEGDGELVINTSAEALNSGSASGQTFSLLNKTIRQRVPVKVDTNDIPEEEKTYYTFSTKIKKNLTGNCYVKVYNSLEEYIIELKEGESSFYGDYEIKELLPKENYYDIEFYGSADSGATFTDNMLAIGKYKTQWTQANGEIMNTQVNINVDGVLVKSSIYLGDYTVMSPLEFAGYSLINGSVTKVFSLNKDTTLVKKLESEDEIKMIPIKIVPITKGDKQGWAFVPST